jgi:hypothetical protein
VDVKTTGELRWERTGRKERERTHRGSMENNTEPLTAFKENDLEDNEAREMVDRIQDAKQSLIVFGRQVFRISSDFGELSRNKPESFKNLEKDHKLFAKKEIIHAQMEEFYKASINYIELLREVNRQAIALSENPFPEKDF